MLQTQTGRVRLGPSARVSIKHLNLQHRAVVNVRSQADVCVIQTRWVGLCDKHKAGDHHITHTRERTKQQKTRKRQENASKKIIIIIIIRELYFKKILI